MPEFGNREYSDLNITSDTTNIPVNRIKLMKTQTTKREILLLGLIIVLLVFTITFLALFANEKGKNTGKVVRAG